MGNFIVMMNAPNKGHFYFIHVQNSARVSNSIQVLSNTVQDGNSQHGRKNKFLGICR